MMDVTVKKQRSLKMICLRLFMISLGCCFGVMCSVSTHAALWTGAIDDLSESHGPFYWGGGSLYQEWSCAQTTGGSGWFYGSAYPSSNADVYVYAGLTDVAVVSDATQFTYALYTVLASEGDTVFFHSKDYYAAWVIDEITPSDGGSSLASLSGQWYFQDDGTGDFSVVPVSIPGSIWLLGGGFVVLAAIFKKRHSPRPA